MSRILVLNGSFCEIPLIEECHRLGHEVVTTGNMPHLAGHRLADAYVEADYSDCEAILKLVRERRIDGILSCANDFGSITAAYVDEQMGWHHHDSFETAKLLHQKDRFKQYMLEKGYPVPRSRAFSEKEAAAAYLERLTDFPVIVKANDLTGGKGILRAADRARARTALDNAWARSRSKHVVIEQYVAGRQQSFFAFLHRRRVVACAGCDCFSYVNPYLIQCETWPSEGLADVRGQLTDIIEAMARDLDLADGLFTFQYMRTDKGVSIFEMMRRPFGNQALRLIEMSTDFPWHRAQIVAETGGDWSLVRPKRVEHPFCGHFGVMAPRNGILRGYAIPPDILAHVVRRFDMKQIGDPISNFENERVTYLHFAYDDGDEMRAAASRYFERIRVDVS